MKLPNLGQAQQIALQTVSANRATEFKAAASLVEPHDHFSTLEDAASTPLYDPFKGRKLNQDYTPSSYIGMNRYRVTSSTTINIGEPIKEPTYRYGDFTDPDDINAFLDQVDRLEGEHKFMFQHLKPTQELLDLVQKMSDEELAVFSQFVVTTSSYHFGTENNNNSAQLISSLSKLSDDALSSTLATMDKLLQQGNDYKKPVSPLGENEHGNERVEMISMPEAINWFKSNYKANSAKYELANDYTNLLIEKNLSEDQLMQLNDHLSDSTLTQSSGIIDMMSLVKNHQTDDVLAMLNEVDKDQEPNLFSYLAQQTNYQANKQYYQMDNGKFVAQQDNISSDSNRRELYNNILNAYNDIGMGWINDALEQFTGSPAQIQNELWQTLLDDKEKMPEQFTRSDSVEAWAINNIARIEGAFHVTQMNKIYDYNSERLVPELIGDLTFYSSGNIRSSVDSEEPQSAENQP
ncbi:MULTISPECIES: hypothetical protein [Pseudoalteromonas]|uniref:hypothetical protein n=1 Tax=Pseudoalteromonas TaxID=53246 RepID=UPI0016013740|nr:MULTISPECIES: hypothetical protein [unclassified Pseudoalteromonas]MBB1335023.1 hypothetical protein [Pseudoalteromonas sp. SR41-6]MBB1460316.1 hypothetical protein [Pseudoalteromonas sp. SG41-8]